MTRFPPNFYSYEGNDDPRSSLERLTAALSLIPATLDYQPCAWTPKRTSTHTPRIGIEIHGSLVLYSREENRDTPCAYNFSLFFSHPRFLHEVSCFPSFNIISIASRNVRRIANSVASRTRLSFYFSSSVSPQYPRLVVKYCLSRLFRHVFFRLGNFHIFFNDQDFQLYFRSRGNCLASEIFFVSVASQSWPTFRAITLANLAQNLVFFSPDFQKNPWPGKILPRNCQSGLGDPETTRIHPQFEYFLGPREVTEKEKKISSTLKIRNLFVNIAMIFFLFYFHPPDSKMVSVNSLHDTKPHDDSHNRPTVETLLNYSRNIRQ